MIELPLCNTRGSAEGATFSSVLIVYAQTIQFKYLVRKERDYRNASR